MSQARWLHPAVQAQDARRQRSRNLRVSLVLVGTGLALFVASILYILFDRAAQ